MSEPNNIAATVFVFRHRETGQITAHYAEASRIASEDADLEHVASLEPRLWIQAHYAMVTAQDTQT